MIMLARYIVGLVDLQMMSEEFGALKQYEASATTRNESREHSIIKQRMRLKIMLTVHVRPRHPEEAKNA
ncbi:unnamed protein product [Dovyalis caffra]|uniref:Uncharacterized protein n=1 Tax=Dovyalis caffra TaxID=77055 RepID=A0AAV1R981_9ROSI|nr:unnamed protein product [Dovyalis caffra]